MMRSYLFTLLLLIVSGKCAFAQYPSKAYEFSNVNAKDVDLELLRAKVIKQREQLDSIYQTNKMDSLELLFKYLNTNTTNYISLTIGMEYISTDYNDLATDLQANGFDPLSEGIGTFGYGFTIKKKRFLHELSQSK